MTASLRLVLLALLLLPALDVDAADFKLTLPLGLQEQAAFVPDDNPLTPEKIALGKQLFWDKRMTKREEHKGAFKTPTLRDVASRPPFMHDGSLRSLAEVVAFYNRGGTPNSWLSADIRPRGPRPGRARGRRARR
jgi:cytochrome c peroxidase